MGRLRSLILQVSSPFKTPEFRELFQKWNQILEDEGFGDAEDFSLPVPALKQWHNLKWKNPSQTLSADRIKDIKRYYDLADKMLETFVFKSPTHRRIWELHCDGLSIRKIADAVHQRKFNKTTVHLIIFEIEKAGGLRRE